MARFLQYLMLPALALGLAACGPSFNRELGAEVDEGAFGQPTLNNTLIMSGERDYRIELGQRFAREVPSTVTFAFNSAQLTPEAMKALDHQANWIRQFPELRFSVYGHTDLVGSAGYNKALGKRRAQAVVAYLESRGVSRSRLQALVSYGKTRPVIQTSGPEQQNRRTVTEVAGFVERGKPIPLNGKYAEVIMREYIVLAEREHPKPKIITTQVNPSQ
ncbi:OmpA family protein [Gemmobacter denitrificans]|uniref:OmpA family protein n=1 Tax=Gemmobacter denitrificans TaxID=3123040 RepID=A0ABU8BYA3_9RHOB